jgi:hypothetical protein
LEFPGLYYSEEKANSLTGSPELLPNDGLPCREVGRWTEVKHRLVSLYATLFSSGMKSKWQNRTYIELYAGAGYHKIEGTKNYSWVPDTGFAS